MFGAVAVRLTKLQVLSSSHLDQLGMNQRAHPVRLSADRGMIFDRDGADLAESVPRKTIWADPTAIKDPYRTAALLAPLLDLDTTKLTADLKDDGHRQFVYVKRKVDDDVAQRVADLKLAGIAAYDEAKRELPNNPDLASVIGSVDIDGKGQSGLEWQYEKLLAGQTGMKLVEQDPSGKDIPGGMRKETPSKRGDDLVLTIDGDLQRKVSSALTEEIQRANAKGGIAAVMDTKTGEILALSNLTVKDDGNGSPVIPSGTNMALTNMYEPGSVSKLITLSGALEEHLVTPSSSFSIPYSENIAGSTFHDADEHPTEQWTTTDILTASSNVGTIRIGQRLGKDKLDQYQRAFGYGATTGLKFPHESAGLILDPKSKHYSGTSLATSAIGQGVSVTAMQMLAAYNTIANGGTWVGPKLVRSTIDSAGKVHDTAPSATRRVVSPETAAQMNLMLQEVVRVGTATAAQIDGYDIAGKTGTARKPNTTGGGYSDKYISTFAGFAPAADPRLTAIVILDEPTPIFGGLVAAPVFSDIVRYALQRYGIAPVPQSGDRHGVPNADASASSAASESDASPGTTADAANAATANANGKPVTSSSTTVGAGSGSTTTTSGAARSSSTTTPPRSTTTVPRTTTTTAHAAPPSTTG